MKTPQEKYQCDPEYHTFVDMLTAMIYNCKFTPSEIREMAMLASIRHEMMRPPEGHAEYLRDQTREEYAKSFQYIPIDAICPDIT